MDTYQMYHRPSPRQSQNHAMLPLSVDACTFAALAHTSWILRSFFVFVWRFKSKLDVAQNSCNKFKSLSLRRKPAPLYKERPGSIGWKALPTKLNDLWVSGPPVYEPKEEFPQHERLSRLELCMPASRRPQCEVDLQGQGKFDRRRQDCLKLGPRFCRPRRIKGREVNLHLHLRAALIFACGSHALKAASACGKDGHKVLQRGASQREATASRSEGSPQLACTYRETHKRTTGDGLCMRARASNIRSSPAYCSRSSGRGRSGPLACSQGRVALKLAQAPFLTLAALARSARSISARDMTSSGSRV